MMQSAVHQASRFVDATDGSTRVLSDDHRDLGTVLNSNINLSVWRRFPEPSVSSEIDVLDAHDLPDVRCRATAAGFDDDLCELLQSSGLDPAHFTAWRADLKQLAGLYFPLTGGRKVTLRLETINNDGCRRFHTDRTNLRMLCTYRGPGTEWLMDEQVDRNAEAAGAPNDEILRYGEPSQLDTFWVGILKGTAFPGNSAGGLVHRSPRISGMEQVRVLFCLDC